MELIKNICAFCSETTSVISSKDSEIYFRQINKDTLNCSHLTYLEFKKLFTSKCLCLRCAHKVDHITTLINHIISNTDNYFTKNLASKKLCNWCHENAENFFRYEKSTKQLQDMITLFVKSVTKKDIPFKEWQLCVNCYFCILAWKDIKDSMSELSMNVGKSVVNGSSSPDDTVNTRSRNREDSSSDTKKPKTHFGKSKLTKTDSDSDTPKRKKRHSSPEIIKSKTPKIRIRLSSRNLKKMPLFKKTAKKRKSDEDLLGGKLKHLKTVHSELSLNEMSVSSTARNDRRMMFDIAYVKINIEEKEDSAIDASGDSLSESETEIVMPSTSKAPTKPPIKLYRKKSKRQKSSLVSMRNSRHSITKNVTFADMNETNDVDSEVESKHKNEEKNDDNVNTSPEQDTQNKSTQDGVETEARPKRSLRMEQKKGNESNQKEKVTPTKKSPRSSKTNQSKQENYNCSICNKEFASRCEQKLHEFQHNIPFSPVVLLDSIPVEREESESENDDTKENDEEAKNDDTKKSPKKTSPVKDDKMPNDVKDESEEANSSTEEEREKEPTADKDDESEKDKVSSHDDDSNNGDAKDKKEGSEVNSEAENESDSKGDNNDESKGDDERSEKGEETRDTLKEAGDLKDVQNGAETGRTESEEENSEKSDQEENEELDFKNGKVEKNESEVKTVMDSDEESQKSKEDEEDDNPKDENEVKEKEKIADEDQKESEIEGGDDKKSGKAVEVEKAKENRSENDGSDDEKEDCDQKSNDDAESSEHDNETSEKEDESKEISQDEENSVKPNEETKNEAGFSSLGENASSQVSVDTTESDEKLFSFECNLDLSDVVKDDEDEEALSSENIVLQIDDPESNTADITETCKNHSDSNCAETMANDSERKRTNNVRNHSDKYEIVASLLEGLGA